MFARQQIRPRTSKGCDYIIEDAVCLAKPFDQATHDHHRNKIGHVGDGLDCALEPGAPDFIQQQRQKDRRRKSEYNTESADTKGIAQEPPEINILKKKFKLLQADPGTVQYPQRWPVILEGNDNPIHGFVGK